MTNATMAGPLTLLQAAAVAEWYDELSHDLRRFVAGVLLHTSDDSPDVDDVLQETFIALMRRVAHVVTLSPEHRRGYAFQTAISAARDRWRRTSRRIDAIPLSATPDAPMQPLTASRDWQTHSNGMEQTTAVRMTLRAVWDATPPEMRELLLLLAAGYTPAEMAERLGISQHGVNMRVWRLRQTLRAAGEAII